ncbi:hypothetical protein G3I42_05300, partial [Streptomyces sp. SID11385]|nr:hypothetical protein [Streptomyces sp. SID11385]
PGAPRSLLPGAGVTGTAAGLVGFGAGTGIACALAGPLGDRLGLPVLPADAVPGALWAALTVLLPVFGLALGTVLASRDLLGGEPATGKGLG